MPDIKLNVVEDSGARPKSGAQFDRQAVIKGQGGDTNYLCGKCGFKVASNLNGNQLVNGFVTCPVCKSVLATPAS